MKEGPFANSPALHSPGRKPPCLRADEDKLKTLGTTSASSGDRGARIVVDTCTYITPILGPQERTCMTPSGKWAWYAPMNLGVEVVFGPADAVRATVPVGRHGQQDRDDR